MEDIFDINLLNELSETINSSKIFANDNNFYKEYNLICSVIPRVNDAIIYSNENYEEIRDNIDNCLLFMVYVSNIRDGIKYLLKILKIKTLIPNNFFINEQKSIKLINNDDFVDDDRFFEYIRSLIFAHPCETSRHYRDQIGEQYSPFINIANKDNEKFISIMIYCANRDKKDFMLDINIKNIISYINYWYSKINDIINFLNKYKENIENNWKSLKINRNQNNIGILSEIRDKLEMMYIDTYDFNDIISVYNLESDNLLNQSSINKFKDDINEKIYDLCDYVDECNYEKIDEIIWDYLPINIKVDKQVMHDYSKMLNIFSRDNLNYWEYNDGMEYSNNLYDLFAKKYVYIDFLNDNYKKIRSYLILAYYLFYLDLR